MDYAQGRDKGMPYPPPPPQKKIYPLLYVI